MFIEDYGWNIRFFSSNVEWAHPAQNVLDYILPSDSWGMDIFFMGQIALHAYASTRIAASMFTKNLISVDLKVIHSYPEGHGSLPDFYDFGPLPSNCSISQFLKLIKPKLKRAEELQSLYSL